MIGFITHPTLTNLLERSRVKMKYQQFLEGVVIVSDYLLKDSHQIHGGLEEAVKYRLTHPSCFIFITSFYSREELLQHDTFGVLFLQGTIFMRLPIRLEKLYTNIEKCAEIELSIPPAEWIVFSTKACKALLKERISVLKHGNKLDFVNSITGPLRATAIGSSSFPELLPVVKQHLQSVKNYTAKEDIRELISLANVSASLPDSFLQSVSQFVKGLQKLEMYALQDKINIKQLISEIEILNETSLKIQTK